MLQEKMGQDAVVVTVFPDDNKKYLSTDLMQEQAPKDGFLAPEVELQAFSAMKRVCHTCCEPDDCAEKQSKAAVPLPSCPRRERGCC